MIVLKTDGERTPAMKLLIAILIAGALAIPIFMVWWQVYDRRSQSEQAAQSITAGWGGPQAMTGPVLVIPYRASATETVVQNGQSVTRSRDVMRELTLAPEIAEVSTNVGPEVRKRSIYEAVVYDAKVSGRSRFAFPPDLSRAGVALEQMGGEVVGGGRGSDCGGHGALQRRQQERRRATPSAGPPGAAGAHLAARAHMNYCACDDTIILRSPPVKHYIA